ncbi:S1C family serine protease [Macrococcus equi]|uniref:S1C family serine protease n=1 Tax=Macrococcus equi TaxID=3395462 RepID=UPI0039BDB5FC
MQFKRKIVIRKRNYKRPKRLFFDEQKIRPIYPYLHKKDNQIDVIPPVDIQREDIDADTADDVIQTEKSAVDDKNINQIEATNIKNEKDINDAQIDKDNVQEYQDDVETKSVKTNEFTDEPISDTSSLTSGEDNRPDKRNKPNKNSLLAVLPKLLMGMLIGILIGMLLMSLFNKPAKEKLAQSPLTVENAIKKNMNNIVSVTNLQKAENTDALNPESASKAPEEAGIGSGVIYKIEKNQAYILTNYHVVGNANAIEVSYDNQKEKAKMIGYDVWTDMAVLTIPKGHLNSVIEMDGSKLVPGQPVIAMGSPLGKMLAGSVSTGVISGLSRSVPVDIDGDEIYDWEMNVLQTDAAINPGNSGGPLLNTQGKMIGLNTMKISMPGVEGIAFSIPAKEIKKELKILETKGSIARPKVGIMIENIGTPSNPDDPNSSTNQDGVKVIAFEPKSKAQESGLMIGDVIKQIDDVKVESKIHFRKILFNDKKIGDTIDVLIERNGVEKHVKIKL